jgi:hypothetical protein
MTISAKPVVTCQTQAPSVGAGNDNPEQRTLRDFEPVRRSTGQLTGTENGLSPHCETNPGGGV